jgi:hypothetical protein
MRRLLCAIGALALTAGVAGASTVTSGLRGTVYVMPGEAGMRIVPTRASVVLGQMKTLRFVVATPHIP